MSDELVIHEGEEAITQSDWGRVQHWMGMAARFGRCSVACQVMAGFELLALHEKHHVRKGAAPSNLGHCVLGSWRELIERELGIQGRTGDRWMRMAELFVAKYGKLNAPERLRTMLGVSPREWSREDTDFIIHFLDEVTEGKSRREFMQDLGVRRKPKAVGQGAESNKQAVVKPDGSNWSAGSAGSDGTAEGASREWREVAERMERYGMKFATLPRHEVADQMLTAVQWLELRRIWLEEGEGDFRSQISDFKSGQSNPIKPDQSEN